MMCADVYGITKSKYKQSMRLFWTKRWKYERTPDDWVALLNGDLPESYKRRHHWLSVASIQSFNKGILHEAIEKLILEKKISKEEAISLKSMLDGCREDQYIAVSAMAAVKPKKFKKIV